MLNYFNFFLCEGTIVKRQVHNNFAGLFFGLPFTKLNTDFAKTVKEKFSPESKLLVVCQEGLRSVTDQAFLLSGSFNPQSEQIQLKKLHYA